MKTHKDLVVWQKSIELVTELYRQTNTFPKSEVYGITNQLRRAAVSIPSNIAEGAARLSRNEFRQFLYVSLGSTAEVETQIVISGNLSFLSEENKELLLTKLTEVRKTLLGLIKSLNN